MLVSPGKSPGAATHQVVRKPMWLQTAMLLTAQLYEIICLLSVGFGRGWKIEKQS